MYDVIIIGAGVEGSATGYHLASKTGKKVLLLEQFDRGHTRGSSHGGSRITRRAYHQSYYVKMMDEAFKLWSDIEKESGKQLYHKTGIIVFGPEKSASNSRKRIQDYIKSMEDNGVSHRVMRAKEVNDEYKDQLKLPDEYLCVSEEDGGILRASKAVDTLQDLFIQNGGELLDNHQVTGIINNDDDTITILTGSGTQFNTKKLILTTGPWTNKVLQYTGIELPLKVHKAEVFYWRTENPKHFSADVFPVFVGISGDGHTYGLPVFEYPDLLKVCPHTYEEIDPDARDVNPTSVGLPVVSQFIKEHFKGVDHTKPAIHEFCIWTQTSNYDPFLDYHPNYPNIIIGAGFSGHGFKLAPIVGKILSELALGETPSYDLSPFKIQQAYTSIPSIVAPPANKEVQTSTSSPPLAPPPEHNLYDVIVVGAGVEGSATAYTLTAKGKRNILLLEQFDRGHTRGSSHGGSRITRRAYHQSYYTGLMDEAFKLWSEIEKKSGKQLYHKTGIYVFGSKDSKGSLKGSSVADYIQSMEDNGVSHRVMRAKEVNDEYKDQLKLPDEYLCVSEEDGGILRASKAVDTLQDLFIQNGGELLDNHQVTGIINNDDDTITVLTGSGTQFNTKKLILTTGPWTNKVLQYIGIELPLKMLRVEHCYWKTLNPESYSVRNFPVFACILSTGLVYGVPILEYPGLVKISFRNIKEIEVDPDCRDFKSSHLEDCKILSEFLETHSFRDLDYSTPAIVEQCIYTKTPSSDPYLDYHPNNPNIIIGAGFSGHGFKLAPIVGKILSELALGETPSYDLSPFKIQQAYTSIPSIVAPPANKKVQTSASSPPLAPPPEHKLYDVIVVGAGAEGSATAYTLTARGKRNILLLEQFDRGHTRGSSSGGSRITRKAYHQGYYVKMMDEAFKLWSDIEKKSGKQLYHKTGFYVFGSKDSKGSLKGSSVADYIQSMEDNGVSHRVMRAKEVNDEYKDQLKLPDEYLCVSEEDGGILRASKAVDTLQDLFIQNGGELLDNHQVTGIINNDNDTITVLTGSGTQFNTKKLILTTGPWTNKVLQYTGIELPLKILKVEHFYWKTLKPESFAVGNFPIFACVLSTGLLYGLPVLEYPGLMKISFHNTSKGTEVDPDCRDFLTPRPEASKIISEFLEAHSFKDLDYSSPAIVEECMYTKTPSGDPYLDYHPNNPNIIIGAGFSGHGFKLAPIVGKILSELALGETPSYDLSPFKIQS
ncbi:PREDICTED: uncharacterized protein LOC100633392 [Amphimedon queenslandica]|uniref:FAD dependent oxidoreductase domain-containing protein n=2 Tax=Amphimedon queenslandica TaxID=400682 RepID=A0AAN0IMS6_AMPQE|nr:PREDICTED: uncharacterized protein LOC100633392 [Amphimedon queenslandica]|eukprot:XP_011404967.1 PREDICTED: uncharacterized protein LOC100633392 [Amphimedon queenslandica]